MNTGDRISNLCGMRESSGCRGSGGWGGHGSPRRRGNAEAAGNLSRRTLTSAIGAAMVRPAQALEIRQLCACHATDEAEAATRRRTSASPQLSVSSASPLATLPP